MTWRGVTAVMAAGMLLLATGARAGQPQDAPDTAAQGVVLQGCVVVAGRASAADRTTASAPTFILKTAPDAGQALDRSEKSYGQSGHPTGQRQTPTGQQTQAGQEPVAGRSDEGTTGPRWPRYRLLTTNEDMRLADYSGRMVVVRGHVASGRAPQRRHDGQPDRQGMVDPLTGLPGPGDQSGQPAPHYTSPDADGDVSGTLTITSLRALPTPCIQER